MIYVALKPLTVEGKRRLPGELVPEAATWRRTRDALIRRGALAEMEEATALVFAANMRAKEPESGSDFRQAPRVDPAPVASSSGKRRRRSS